MNYEIWNETKDFAELLIRKRVLTIDVAQELYDDGYLYVASYPTQRDTVVIARKLTK